MSNPEIARLREIMAARPRPADINELRKGMDGRGLAYGLAADVAVEKTNADGVNAEWTSTPGANPHRAILYVHGGGYVFGSLDSHRHACAEMGRAAGARVLALDYRLAPEHPFPAPVEDTVSGYRHLLANGFTPASIAIAGDSAGGGLVIAALLAIKEAGLPQPACGWAISPWVDMEALGGSMDSKAAEDPMVQKLTITEIAKLYLNGADPRHPHAAPMYGDLAGIAPLLIQVGAAETLFDDAIRIARIAGAAHVPVSLEVWPEMIHVWHLFYPQLAAGRRAIAGGGAYVKAVMDGNPPITARVG